MNGVLNDLLKERANSQSVSILTGNILVILMMMTVGIGIAQAGARFVPIWRGGYLVWIGLLISLEAISTRKRASLLEGQEKLIFRISEWVAIAVTVKIILYLIHGPEQLLKDLPLWQQDFFTNFFTGEYMVALVYSAGTWWSTSAFAGELDDLYDREKDAEWDELGKLQNALKGVRLRISTRVFAIGTLLVILAIISRVDASAIFRERGAPPASYQSSVANVLIYFILALVLLSLTQFALMRTRWLSQRLPVSSDVTRNWLRYSLAFFALLAVVVFFLPTEYSLNLLDTLRYTLDFLVKAITFLFVLITLPLSFCLSLFRITEPVGQDTASPVPFQPPPAADPRQPLAWLEVLRSLMFWVLFVSIIVFAVRYYFMQNSGMWLALRSLPLIRWISNVLAHIRDWLKGANRQISSLVKRGIERLRPQNVSLPTKAIRRLFNLARLGSREKIIFYYLSLIQLGGERGLERRPAQTPYQYENRLASELPEISQELHDLTGSFIEARYSRHPFEEPNAVRAASHWERIKSVLRNWPKPD